MNKPKIPVLRIRDENGNFIPINAIKGESAYEQAKKGGYKGTEEEFIALLNGLTNAEDATHYSNFNNPHRVTKEQIGLGEVENVSINNQTPTYRIADELTEVESGETISTAFSKIKKLIREFMSHTESRDHIERNANGGILIGDIQEGYECDDSSFVGIGNVADLGENGVAIGDWAEAIGGVAIGEGSAAEGGVAIGKDAYALADCIQLGSGENGAEGTVQIFNYMLLDANGKIPSARLNSDVLRAVSKVEQLIETLYKAGKLTEEEYNEIINGTEE